MTTMKGCWDLHNRPALVLSIVTISLSQASLFASQSLSNNHPKPPAVPRSLMNLIVGSKSFALKARLSSLRFATSR